MKSKKSKKLEKQKEQEQIEMEKQKRVESNLNSLQQSTREILAQSLRPNSLLKKSAGIERNMSTPNLNYKQAPLKNSQQSSYLQVKDLAPSQQDNASSVHQRADLLEASQKLMVHKQYQKYNSVSQNEFSEFDDLNKEFKKMFNLNNTNKFQNMESSSSHVSSARPASALAAPQPDPLARPFGHVHRGGGLARSRMESRAVAYRCISPLVVACSRMQSRAVACSRVQSAPLFVGAASAIFSHQLAWLCATRLQKKSASSQKRKKSQKPADQRDVASFQVKQGGHYKNFSSIQLASQQPPVTLQQNYVSV